MIVRQMCPPVALLVGVCVLLSGCGEQAPPAEKPGPPAASGGGQTVGARSGREVLEAMAATYRKANSYVDRGVIRFQVDRPDEPIDRTDSLSILFERPGKLRLDLYEVKAVLADGTLHAALESLPGQVVVRTSPSELSLDTLGRVQVLAPALGPNFAEHFTRLVLLLGDNGLRYLLEGAEEPELAEPGEIEGRACHRVRIRREGQVAVLWIDQQSFVLRRIVLPAEGAIAGIPGQIRSASLVAEFVGAELDATIPPEAFQFEIPEGAEVVRLFRPPHLADLLGKQASGFQFTGATGDAIGVQSLAEKVVVLDFWALNCEPCRASLPMLDKLRRQYADHPNVAFLAVNVDPPDAPDTALAALFSELDVQMPMARDRQQHAFSVFRIPGVPTLFVLDGKGIVQYYAIGADPRRIEKLPEVIDSLLAGRDTYEPQQREYQEQLRQMAESLDRAETSAAEPIETGPGVPETQIAPRSEPRNMRLSQLWANAELKSPGNLLVFQRDDGQKAIAVVDAWKQIAELSLEGSLLTTHEPPIEPTELFNALRAATDANGNRYFAAVALMSGQQRFHLFDGQFRLLLSFPPDALHRPHSGIADVQLADLVGDGTLRAYVGYWGEVGVQEVSLTGERTWSNRNVANVQKMAVSAPNADGARRLLCANVSSTLAALVSDGAMAMPLSLGERLVGWIASADLEGNGRTAYCAMAAEKLGENEAIGLTIEGNRAQIAWTYRLPDGVSRQPVDPIVFGRATAEGPGHWLLPGPDGSIHILSVDGKLLDSFHCGEAIQGIAATEIGGQPTLIIATAEGVTAWAVE